MRLDLHSETSKIFAVELELFVFEQFNLIAHSVDEKFSKNLSTPKI